MRKLSSLTEMISSQYNPFVGEAPPEREPLPSVDAGLGAVAPAVTLVAPPPPVEPPGVNGTDAADPAATAPDPPVDPFAPDVSATEADADEAAPTAIAAPPAPRLTDVPPGFESTLLMLSWADTLLKHAPTRDAVTDLVAYYHRIAWIGDAVRDQILAYVDGIAWSPGPAAPIDWRVGADVHERSLLYIEKLRAAGRARA